MEMLWHKILVLCGMEISVIKVMCGLEINLSPKRKSFGDEKVMRRDNKMWNTNVHFWSGYKIFLLRLHVDALWFFRDIKA